MVEDATIYDRETGALEKVSDPDAHKPSTVNEFNLHSGANLPNHSTSLAGRGRYVRQGHSEIPTFRTRQAAYRYAARLVELAGNWLPDESEECSGCTFEAIREAMIEEGVK